MIDWIKHLSKPMQTVVGAIAAMFLTVGVAMQFTDEANWGVADFVIMGLLVIVTGAAYVFLTKTVDDKARRILIGAGLIAVFLWVWVELAVGVFTNWGS